MSFWWFHHQCWTTIFFICVNWLFPDRLDSHSFSSVFWQKYSFGFWVEKWQINFRFRVFYCWCFHVCTCMILGCSGFVTCLCVCATETCWGGNRRVWSWRSTTQKSSRASRRSLRFGSVQINSTVFYQSVLVHEYCQYCTVISQYCISEYWQRDIKPQQSFFCFVYFLFLFFRLESASGRRRSQEGEWAGLLWWVSTSQGARPQLPPPPQRGRSSSTSESATSPTPNRRRCRPYLEVYSFNKTIKIMFQKKKRVFVCFSACEKMKTNKVKWKVFSFSKKYFH